MSNTAHWLSFAKLRASYGQVGNDNMNGARFAFLTLWSGSHESQIGNNELVWEKANKYNIGLETRFLNHFGLEADIFYEKRDNILIPATGLIPTGLFGTGGVHVSGIIPKINAGVIDNRGFELTGSYQQSFGRETCLDIKANAPLTGTKLFT